MKIHWIFIISVSVAYFSCRSSLKVPAIPETPMETTKELAYIYTTDQNDRWQFKPKWERKNNKKFQTLLLRDSIRLSRVLFLFQNDTIKRSEWDNYFIAFVLLHGGGPKMKDDTTYFKLSQKLFTELGKNAEDIEIKKRSQFYVKVARERYIDAKAKAKAKIHKPTRKEDKWSEDSKHKVITFEE